MKNARLWCFILLFPVISLRSQTLPICQWPGKIGADNCTGACIFCALDGYHGFTGGFTTGAAPGFCAAVDNDQWIGFLAAGDSISIRVDPLDCKQGNGIEIALYAACDALPLACTAGQAGEGDVARILTAPLVPGEPYFLMIDGFQGDVCEFFVQASPPGATSLLMVDSAGPVQGPAIVAAGGTNVYSVAPVSGATAYTWTAPPDAKINGQSAPVTLPAPHGNQVTVTFGSRAGQVCVTPANPCRNGAPACLNVAPGNILPPPCPSNSIPAADLCEDICVYCDFNGYTGTTSGYSGQTPPGFCGTIENEQWIGFVAGVSAATFTTTPSNCANGNGIQIALYPSCSNAPIKCDGGATGGGNMPVSVTAALTPGVSYYLLIDGYAGDQCDFQLTVSPPSAGLAQPIGPTGVISGPSTVCPGANVAFSVLPVSGAGAYAWTAPPGWLVNGQAAPVTLVGAGGNVAWVTAGAQAGPICVQPANSCNNGAPVCKNVALQPIPIKQLPPVVVCAEDVPYELPWGDLCFTSGAYETTLTSYQGCDSVVRQLVTVKSPIIKFLTPQTICAGDSVVVCGEVFTQAGSYAKTCESFQGCDSTINFNIVILEPLAKIIPEAVDCAVAPVILNSALSAGIKLWKDENGQIIGNGNTVTVNDPGIYILEVNTSAGGNICTARDTVLVRLGTIIPEASAFSTDTLTCIKTAVALHGSTDIAGVLFNWAGPNGFQSALKDPLVETPGQYMLTVTDPLSGCSNQTTVAVQANVQAPDAQLSSGTVSCATPVVPIVCQTTISNASFFWSGPDGFTSQDQQPFTSTPGIYTVTLTDPGNGCSTAVEIFVPGDTLPPTVVAAGGVLTCLAETVQLTCTTGAASPSFFWTGPSGFVSSEQNPLATLAGQYEVTVADANGCTASASAIIIDQTQGPAIGITGDSLSCKQPIATLLCSTLASQPVFTWKGPGGFSSESQHLAVTTPGTYTVTVTDESTGCTNSASVFVPVIDTLPDVTIAAGGELTCVQKNVLLEGASTAANPVFSWSGPGGFSASGSFVAVSMPGLYFLTATDTLSGCAGSSQINLTENLKIPQATVSGAGTITCAIPALTLSGNADTPGAAFQWLIPDLPPVDGSMLSVNMPGLYILTVTDLANGCVGTASALVLQDTVSPATSLRVDTITCRSDSIFIGVAAPQAYQFDWSGPNGFSSQAAGFWIGMGEIGIYTVTITNPGNGCTQILQVDDFIQNLAPPVVSTVSVVNDQFGQQIGAIAIEILYPGSVTVIWYKDSVLFSFSEDLTGLAAGTYTAVVTANDNGCSATHVVEVVNITVSTGETPEDDPWELFPNPANTRLQLHYRGPGNPEAQVQAFDITGRTVFLQTVVPTPVTELAVDHLPPGLYRMQIKTKETSIWKTIVIQR